MIKKIVLPMLLVVFIFTISASYCEASNSINNKSMVISDNIINNNVMIDEKEDVFFIEEISNSFLTLSIVKKAGDNPKSMGGVIIGMIFAVLIAVGYTVINNKK